MVDSLLRAHPIISDQIDKKELRVILQELEKIHLRKVAGDIVEFGCYEGTTSLFIQRLLNRLDAQKTFHVYDSFAGLPEKSAKDMSPAGEQFRSGELLASKRNFVQNFRRAGLTPPVIHKGWFRDLKDAEVPKTIAFAFLDGDFYDSIMDSFAAIENNLSQGAVIVVDDYQSDALPGAARAVHAWLGSHPGKLRTEASLAIIQT